MFAGHLIDMGFSNIGYYSSKVQVLITSIVYSIIQYGLLGLLLYYLKKAFTSPFISFAFSYAFVFFTTVLWVAPGLELFSLPRSYLIWLSIYSIGGCFVATSLKHFLNEKTSYK